jgi:acyl CoA:acetate/3-ketoacid CoA transferase beta subunit
MPEPGSPPPPATPLRSPEAALGAAAHPQPTRTRDITGRPGGTASLAEVCVVACAEAWRGDGAILASPVGLMPTLGARLAQLTFAPDLLVTDGEAALLAPADRGRAGDGAAQRDGGEGDGGEGDDGTEGWVTEGWVTEGWLPYRGVFTLVAAGRRHMMMGAAQLDRFGNQNISCIGDWARPKAQLLGVRGAPGNTINHPVSYWVPRHSRRVFVEQADMVSGIGYDRAAGLGAAAARFHELRLVVTNLAVLDFGGADHAMRLRSVHPGVSVADVTAATGFPLAVPAGVPVTRLPTSRELALIRDRLDPAGQRDRELA